MGRSLERRRLGRAVVAGVVALTVPACGGKALSTGTTLDVCSLIPPAQVEEAVGSEILLKPIVPSVEVRRTDLGGALLDLLGDSSGDDRSPAPTTRDRVSVQGLCGYVFEPEESSTGPIQSLVLGVYPMSGDPTSWLDTTAGTLSDHVLIRSGAVPSVTTRADLGEDARLVRTEDGVTAIVLAVDHGTGVVAEGSAIDVPALETLTRAALSAATRAVATTTPP